MKNNTFIKKFERFIGISVMLSITLLAVYVSSWYQAFGAWTSNQIPQELEGFSIEGHSDLNGIIYFDASQHLAKGEPGSAGNFLIQFNTKTEELSFRRVNGLAMKFERHTDDILSYYDYGPSILIGQDLKLVSAGIPVATGGAIMLVDSNLKQIRAISDNEGVDLHEFLIAENGNYIYLSTEISTLYKDSTITCLPTCFMLFQSIVETSPDGTEIYRYPLSDYFKRNDFIMDDILQLGTIPLYDLTHVNSVSLADDDNTLIISVRHTNEVLAISRDNGALLWRTSDFEFIGDSLNGFRHQHDVSLSSDNKLLMFDNGNGLDIDKPYSRIVEYRLDIEKKTAVLDYEYHTDDYHYAPNRGSVQWLPDGSILVNWVNRDKDDIQIIDASGDIVLSISIPGAYASYQAQFWSME